MTKMLPRNTLSPMLDESAAVTVKPMNTTSTLTHCKPLILRPKNICEKMTVHIVTDEYIMANIVGPAIDAPV
eukprot:CAMPEP_0168182738 /NCGR_PEP_ID=MMETSP0139_2-20121125/12054_1 /TAXON_ID=44445 /ORGANISM="Pseudo-nitzschia australis, Strain 10249 10 AB" /LENGTH=71 /DNA_ID=CAMNT_0008103689 /DNA_START=693 /DNA_END=908 /DNA_ORIENTATION=+